MKKLVVIVALLFAFAGISVAQTAPAKKDTARKEVKKTPVAKKQEAPAKKDGTPDMRYKANKTAAADTTKRLKKDGTPDKRFKENKKKS